MIAILRMSFLCSAMIIKLQGATSKNFACGQTSDSTTRRRITLVGKGGSVVNALSWSRRGVHHATRTASTVFDESRSNGCVALKLFFLESYSLPPALPDDSHCDRRPGVLRAESSGRYREESWQRDRCQDSRRGFRSVSDRSGTSQQFVSKVPGFRDRPALANSPPAISARRDSHRDRIPECPTARSACARAPATACMAGLQSSGRSLPLESLQRSHQS